MNFSNSLENKIFHVLPTEDLEKIQHANEYIHESLAKEGFIHLSKPHQINWVIQNFFQGKEDLHVMVIDPKRVQARLVYEGPDKNHPWHKELMEMHCSLTYMDQ